VLKYAFEGKLTEIWRRDQDLTGLSNLSGLGSGKPAKPLPPLTETELAELPGLPEGWVWSSIEQLASSEPRSIQSGPFVTIFLRITRTIACSPMTPPIVILFN
jgi:hypothetical protein